VIPRNGLNCAADIFRRVPGCGVTALNSLLTAREQQRESQQTEDASLFHSKIYLLVKISIFE
jgi:hypothetical protein